MACIRRATRVVHGPRENSLIEIRSFAQLAGVDRGWLKAKIHFDFAGLGRADHPPLGVLRVWNDDEFAPASGFPMHAHSNVEIITYVREGAITHEDDLGNRGIIKAGDVQVMRAGKGIRHSEFNAEKTTAKLFQIWLTARTADGTPQWKTRAFPLAESRGCLVPLVSGSLDDLGALEIDADARVLGGTFAAGSVIDYEVPARRRAYVVSTSGRVDLNGVRFESRDGAAVTDESRLRFDILDDTELFMIEVS